MPGIEQMQSSRAQGRRNEYITELGVAPSKQEDNPAGLAAAHTIDHMHRILGNLSVVMEGARSACLPMQFCKVFRGPLG